MKFSTYCFKTFFIVIFGLTIFIGGVVQIQAQELKPQSLTLQELLTGLESTSSGMSLENKNEYIIMRVNEIGVDFSITSVIEKSLREAGANDSLIQTIRLKAPKSKNISPAIRAEATRKREERDQAIKDYTKAIEKNPKDEEAYIKRALAYFYAADYELSMEDYVRVLEINPENQTAKFRLTGTLKRIGKYFLYPARRSNSDNNSGATVKGFISTGNVKRREMMLSPPFYSRRRNNGFKRKRLISVLAFINEKGRVVSTIALNGDGFPEARPAIMAARSSTFFEAKSSARSTNDWVIIVYEFDR